MRNCNETAAESENFEPETAPEAASISDIMIGLSRPELSAELLLMLAYHSHPKVRERVARHPRTPAATVAALLKDSEWRVRLAAGLHPNLTLKMLINLTGDRQDELRFALAANQKMPITVLAILSRDNNPVVAERAAETISMLYDV